MFFDLHQIQEVRQKQSEKFITKRSDPQPNLEEDFYIIQKTIQKVSARESALIMKKVPVVVDSLPKENLNRAIILNYISTSAQFEKLRVMQD